MEYMYKAHYKNNSNIQNELLHRFESPTTYKLNYHIKPFNYSESAQAYFIPTLTFINHLQKFYHLYMQQVLILDKLPGIAKKSFYKDLIISEIYLTHKIEGVRSSKKEIKMTLRQLEQTSSNKKLRFKSIIQTYLDINNQEPPKVAEEIRSIFDKIAVDEIETHNAVDTELFRKENSDVTTVTQKTIHRGIAPSQIQKDLQYILDFVNEDNEVDYLIKIAIFHYLFGYIHPFYDGNGRTNRYITSLFLAHQYHPVVALSLSTAINNHKKLYEKMSNTTNSFQNRGELNFFIDHFFELLIEGQQIMIDQLNDKITKLKKAKTWLTNKALDNIENKIIFILIQAKLFDDEYLALQQLNQYINVSEQTLRKYLKQLETLPFTLTKGQKPKQYTLIDNFYQM